MTRYSLPPLLLLLVTLSASAQPAALDLRGKTLEATFAELLPGMSAADNGARSAAQQRWQDICFALGAPGNEKQRKQACKLMAAKLDEKTPKAARLWLLQQLQRLGNEECLDALAAVLDDKDDEVRDMGIRALANNPSTYATGKLVTALPAAKGKAKIGILNALGHRGEAEFVKDIAKELQGEPDVAVAAANALGRIHGSDATDALIDALSSSKALVRNATANALLAHADYYLKKGNKKLAAILYERMNNARETRPIRMAALRGVILTGGDKAGDLVLTILRGEDANAKKVAIGQIENLTPKALKVLADNLDIVTAPTRVAVITAIAARGDRSQMPVALSAAKSKEAEVKRAGIIALGRLGDASTVEFLLDAMSGKDASAGLAAESLAALAVEGVNEKLISVLEAEKVPARKVALIGILDRRKAASGVPAILKAAGDADAGVRTAAFAALKGLATPADVPGMIPALFKTAKGNERDQAEIAIVAVLSQVSPEKRAEPVLATLKDATGNRVADLLPLLGRLGGPEALKLIREELASSIPLLKEAAVTALCNWPDVSANNDMLALVQTPRTPADKSRAIGALIRVNTVLIDRTDQEKVAALNTMKKTMLLATDESERRSILENIGFVRHIATLRFVVPYLDQPEYMQAACKGVVELAHSKNLREPNKAEFDRVLNRVIAVCKDKGLVERAKNYKEGR